MNTTVGRWFSSLKIRYKLTLAFSTLLLSIILFNYLYFPSQQKAAVYEEMYQRIHYVAKSLALSYGVAMAGEMAAIKTVGLWLRQDSSFRYYYIFDENREIVDAFPDNQPERQIDLEAFETKPVRNGSALEIMTPIQYKNKKNLGYIILGMDLEAANKRIYRINITSTIIFIALFLLSFIITFFLNTFISKPINSLMNTVNQIIRTGDYSETVSVEPGAKDEVGFLASRFNDMLERIEERDIELKQQNDQLIEANRLKNNFLAATTHDLRSPITAILGFSDLMLMNDALSDLDRKRLNHIKNSTNFLATMVDDILDLSKLESDRTDLIMRPVAIRDIVNSSINTLQYMAMPKSIKIQLSDNLPPGKDPAICGNAESLLRVMNNLISNAIKFTPDHGRISVKMTIEDTKLCIAVSDNGIGIPDEKIPALFDTYSKSSRSGTNGEKGTGLGLSISKRLIDKHGGSISVESKIDNGTTFTILLPLQIKTGVKND